MRIDKRVVGGLGAFTLVSCSLLFDAEELKTGAASGGTGGHGLEAGTSGSSGSSGDGGSSGSAPSDASSDGEAPDSGCPAGYGDCDSAAPGCETLLVADPANCGACGHSCFGSACTAGLCAPELLFTFPTASSGDEFPTFVALHAGSLYAAFLGAQGGAWRIDDAAQAFKPAVKVLTKPNMVDVAPFATGLVASAIFGTIRVEGKNPFDLVSTGGWGLDVSGTKLAVANIHQVLVFDIPQIATALEVPGTTVLPTKLLETGSELLDVSIAGNEYCYTRTTGTVGCTSWAGALGVTPPPYAITNDGTYVYWTEGGSGGTSYGVQRALIAPLAGPNPPKAERVMSGGYRSHGLALASGKLFAAIIGGEGDAIVEADADGTGRRVLAKTTQPFGVAVDDTFLYYSSWDGVFRLRR